MPRAKTPSANEAKPKSGKAKTVTPKTPVAKTPVAKVAKKPADKAATPKPAAKPRAAGTAKPSISTEERQRMIAVAAYFRAERRGFHPGYEDEDWRAAEDEINQLLGR